MKNLIKFVPLAIVGLIAALILLTTSGCTAKSAEPQWEEVLQEWSNRDDGSTYGEVIGNIYDYKEAEVMVIFDRDRNKIFNYSNDNGDMVFLPAPVIAAIANGYQDVIHMHSHSGHDSCFSLNDLQIVGDEDDFAKAVKSMVVVGSEHVYTLTRRDDQTWPTSYEVSRTLLDITMAADPTLREELIGTEIEGKIEFTYFKAEAIRRYAQQFDLQFSIQSVEDFLPD